MKPVKIILAVIVGLLVVNTIPPLALLLLPIWLVTAIVMVSVLALVALALWAFLKALEGKED
jgi:protein-S-isoprenylcysteine O-methyltransferase Ste14